MDEQKAGVNGEIGRRGQSQIRDYVRTACTHLETWSGAVLPNGSKTRQPRDEGGADRESNIGTTGPASREVARTRCTDTGTVYNWQAVPRTTVLNGREDFRSQ
jgi:hypothetical protein